MNGVIVLLLYIIVFLNAYRLYRYYKFMQLHGWDQYGNPDFMNGYEDGYDSYYKDLKTPKNNETPRRDDNGYRNNSVKNKAK